MLQEQGLHVALCSLPTATDGLSDPAFESLARVNSSRRKQSKPLRVFAEDKTDNVSAPAVATEPHKEDTVQKSAFSLFRNEPPQDSDNGGVSLAARQEKDEAGRVDNVSNDEDSSCNEFYSKPDYKESDVDGMSAAAGNNNNGGFRSRIFHKDAYCELCNREFCNKYFLKTHKANKHGHGTSGKPESLVQDLPTPTTNSAAANAGHVTNGSSEGVLVPPYFTVPPLSSLPALPSVMSDSAAKTFGTLDGKFDMPPSIPRPPLVANTLPTDSFQLPDKRTPVNADMEDFCEFCQKHFCNKYYLRKHKLDVHGIFSEKSSSGRRGGGQKVPPAYGMHLPMASLSSATSLPLMPPPLSAGMTSMAALDPLGTSAMMPDVNALTNLMFLNPFASPLSLVQPSAMMGTSAPGLLPGLPPLLPLPSMPGRPFDASSLFGGDGVKRSDSNGNAFCQLCRKEFYNDYFLNMHLLTKHGIPPAGDFSKLAGMEPLHKLRPEDDLGKQAIVNGKEDKGLHYLCELCNKSFGGKAELQLHMLQCQRGKADKTHEEQQLKRSDSDTALRHVEGAGPLSNFMTARLVDRVVCDICNKEVCNKYFLKTHKQKIHGISVSTLVSEKESSDSASNGSSLPANGSAAPSSTHLAQGRALHGITSNPSADDLLKLGIDPESYCELCKKEFSSKYFLKMHKLNMHGVRSETDVRVLPSSMEKLAQLGSQPVPSALGDVAEQVNTVASTPEKCMVALEDRGLNGSDSSGALVSGISPQRVFKCSHCDKDLCNRYFLKAHMLDRHGIILPASDSDSTGDDRFTSHALPDASVSAIGLDLSVKSLKLVDKQLNNGHVQHCHVASEKNAHSTQQHDNHKRFKLELARNSGGHVQRHMNRVGNGTYWRRRYQVKKRQHSQWPRSGSGATDVRRTGERPVMQTFFVEPVQATGHADGAQAFTKAVISIPVRREINRPVQVTFLVTPAHRQPSMC